MNSSVKVDQSIDEDRPPIQVQEAQLRDFIANGAITRIQAIGKAEGFELHAHIGSATAALANARGVIRTFGSLNTLTGLIKRLGVSSFDVEIRDFEVLPRTAIKPAKQGETG